MNRFPKFRAVLTIVVLLASISVAGASIFGVHQHADHTGNSGICDLCVAGHLTWENSAWPEPGPGLMVQRWHAFAETTAPTFDVANAVRSPRAPPAV